MIKAILLVLAALPILAQNPGPVYPTSTDPTGNACSGNVAYLVGPTGIVVTCQNGTYAPVSAQPRLPARLPDRARIIEFHGIARSSVCWITGEEMTT